MLKLCHAASSAVVVLLGQDLAVEARRPFLVPVRHVELAGRALAPVRVLRLMPRYEQNLAQLAVGWCGGRGGGGGRGGSGGGRGGMGGSGGGMGGKGIAGGHELLSAKAWSFTA